MTGIVADPFCKQHDTGDGHPGSPARFDAVLDGLKNAGLLANFFPSKLATRRMTNCGFVTRAII